jgi:hypothetical protein
MRILFRIWRLLTHPHQLQKQVRFAWNYAIFRLRYGFLQQGVPPVDPNKKVLFVSLSDWFPRLKMEGILAKSLQLQGYTPVILTLKSCKWAPKFFGIFGITEFLYYDDLIKEVALDEDEKEADEFFSKNPTFHEVLSRTHGGVDVGKRVLSTTIKKLCHGRMEFNDPRVQPLLRECLVDSLHAARVAEKVLTELKPEVLFIIDRAYTPHGEFADRAVEHGINTVLYCHGHRQDALVVKRYTSDPESRHMDPFSLSRPSWEYMKSIEWGEDKEDELMVDLERGYKEGTWFHRQLMLWGRKIVPVDELKQRLKLDPNKKTAVIFSHVLWDGSVCYGESVFDDYGEWLVETVQSASENPHVNWVLKLHPDYRWRIKKTGEIEPLDLATIKKHLGDIPDNLHIVPQDTDISTYSFFGIADYCVTVRGTVGIECACHGIPTITAGTGRYAGYGFTEDSYTKEEYKEKIRNIHEVIQPMSQEKRSLARRYAYGLFMKKPMPFTTWEMIPQTVGGCIDYNVVIRARSFADIEKAQDLKRFADWVLHTQEEDHVNYPVS